MTGEIKLVATGYCEKCRLKDLELTADDLFILNRDSKEYIYEIHCKHEEICREWNEKFESLKRAFDMHRLKQVHYVAPEDLKKLHEYLDANTNGTRTDGK